MKLFFDTGAFCALSLPEDRHNAAAKLILKRALTANPRQFTSNYILDETYTLIRSRRGHTAAVNFMDGFKRLGISVLRVTEVIEDEASTLFRKLDFPHLSFTDCTSFALINAHAIDHAFSFDAHFSFFRFSHPVIILPESPSE